MKKNIIRIGDECLWNNGKVKVLDIFHEYNREDNPPTDDNLSEYGDEFTAIIENERNHRLDVYYTDLEVIRNIEDLDKEDLKKLRGEVVIGSLYFDDYLNSFGIDKNELLNWCDEYIFYLFFLCGSKYVDLSVAYEKDNPETFAYFMANKEDLAVSDEDFEVL